jgi:hypothetical protein
MLRYWIALAAVMLCLLPMVAFSQQAPSDEEIRAAIAKVGEGTDQNGFARLEILYRNPCRSAQLLISSLTPVRCGQYLTGKHPKLSGIFAHCGHLQGWIFVVPQKPI